MKNIYKNVKLIIFIIIILFLLSINSIQYLQNKYQKRNQAQIITYLISKNFNTYIDYIKQHNLIIKIPNIYLSKKSTLLWVDYKKDYFTQCNWPNTIDWDYKIKKDILEKSLALNKNEAIIDCGAHIGDMTIPLSHALKENNRSDVTVYALDPSPEKCKYIEFLADINDLTNIKVICCGLNSKKCKLYPQIPLDLNTGATEWTDTKVHSAYNSKKYRTGEPSIFVTLDNLIETKQINHIIKIIHLDVEGHEKKAIIGGHKTITKYKPYISLETHNDERDSFERILQNNYRFVKRLRENNIFSSKI